MKQSISRTNYLNFCIRASILDRVIGNDGPSSQDRYENLGSLTRCDKAIDEPVENVTHLVAYIIETLWSIFNNTAGGNAWRN